MRKSIALVVMVLVTSFYPMVLAAERTDAEPCQTVWNSSHTKVLYITCPIDGEVDYDS